MLHCRVLKIQTDRFSVDLSCKTSDLLDKEGKFRNDGTLKRDDYYDEEAQERDKSKEEEKKKQKVARYKKLKSTFCRKLDTSAESGKTLHKNFLMTRPYI